jgi:hypothetical protein
MKKTLRASEVEALLREIQRYLAYVDAFRTAGQPEEGRKHQEEGPKDG